MAQKPEKQPIDLKDVENGPITEANRQCRDIFCCLLFLACIAAMGYLTWHAYYFGTPDNSFRGVDSNGEICGDLANTNTASYPYLYFTNPPLDITARVCLASCPYYDGSAITTPLKTGGSAIVYAASLTGSTWSTTPTLGTQVVGYDTTAIIGRVCIPSAQAFTAFTGITPASNTTFASVLGQKDLASFISDVQNNWQWLLAAFGLAIVIGFIFMFLLRCIAGCIVWLSLFGTIFFLIALGLIFLYNAGYMGAAADVASTMGVPSISTGYNEIYGWVCIGVGILFLIVVLCCCSRLRLAVAVCKCAGQFVSGVCLIILVPVFQTILALGLWGGCLVVMVFLVGSTRYTATSSDYFSSVADYGDEGLIRFYVFVFCTLWSNAFIGAMTIFVIASACCMWYYSHGPSSELSLPIWRSYKMIFRYHFGSLAFGSLLLAIIQALQIMVELFKKQAEASGGNNKCVQYVTNCLRCCLACVERIVQFINTTAYIQIALRGKNFCMAAYDGFDLAWSNAMRYAVVGGVGQIMMFLGKITIAASTSFGFYCLITYVTQIQKGYLYPLYSIILVFIMAFLVGMLFMAVYSIAMDTLLQCFIVDETNSKGKGSKAAQYAPQDLADCMDIE